MMRGEFDIKNNGPTEARRTPRTAYKPRRNTRLRPFAYSVLASLGIFGGISSLFVGIVSVIIHGIVSGDKVFDRVGTILLIVAIPMILLGSVFLDGIEIKK